MDGKHKNKNKKERNDDIKVEKQKKINKKHHRVVGKI